MAWLSCRSFSRRSCLVVHRVPHRCHTLPDASESARNGIAVLVEIWLRGWPGRCAGNAPSLLG